MVWRLYNNIISISLLRNDVILYVSSTSIVALIFLVSFDKKPIIYTINKENINYRKIKLLRIYKKFIFIFIVVVFLFITIKLKQNLIVSILNLCCAIYCLLLYSLGRFLKEELEKVLL
jgi:hypothetical protein